MSMLTAPSRCPSANSAGVRTSRMVVPARLSAAAKSVGVDHRPVLGGGVAVGPAVTLTASSVSRAGAQAERRARRRRGQRRGGGTWGSPVGIVTRERRSRDGPTARRVRAATRTTTSGGDGEQGDGDDVVRRSGQRARGRDGQRRRRRPGGRWWPTRAGRRAPGPGAGPGPAAAPRTSRWRRRGCASPGRRAARSARPRTSPITAGGALKIASVGSSLCGSGGSWRSSRKSSSGSRATQKTSADPEREPGELDRAEAPGAPAG